MDSMNERITKYFESHKDGFYIDDITCNDIDFDRIYDAVNRTSSSLGDEILYYMLRTPNFDPDALSELEKKLEHYSEDSSERKKSIQTLKSISKLKKISVFEYLNKLDEIKNISKTLYENGIIPVELSRNEVNLEDYYMKMVQTGV